jgi:hypothetical protein
MIGVDDVWREFGNGGLEDPGEGRPVLDDLQLGQGGADGTWVGHDIAHAHDGKTEVMPVEANDPKPVRPYQLFRHRKISANARNEKRLMPPAPALTDHFLDVFPAAGEVRLLADDV